MSKRRRFVGGLLLEVLWAVGAASAIGDGAWVAFGIFVFMAFATVAALS